MNEIIFPAINLNLSISNIAVTIGTIDIYWYGICITFGILIAIIGTCIDSKIYKIDTENILEMFVIALPISLICARLYYILFELDYYLLNPLEIINIRSGGLAIYGGIIGFILSIIIYCKIKKIEIVKLLDLTVPYIALAQSIGRWGNFFNVEAYGKITDSIFRMGIIENGTYIEVHPTFLYESIATFILFIILTILKIYKKKELNKNEKVKLEKKSQEYKNENKIYDGFITLIYLMYYGIIRFFIEGLRTDSLMLGTLRISQILSLIIVIVCIIILVIKKLRVKNKSKKLNND